MRTLAIGDIHGHLQPLRALLALAAPRDGDLLVFLGDYVDKGPDIKGVIDALITLTTRPNTIFLRGNHDQMMIDAYRTPVKAAIWECLAGSDPLASYGAGPAVEVLPKVPLEHWHFLESQCRDYFATPDYIFVHGGLRPHIHPADEDPERLYWMPLSTAERHSSGRTVICGHSAQRSGHIADLGHTICIDTGISHGNWLSCLALDTFEYWQTNADGQQRNGTLPGRSRP